MRIAIQAVFFHMFCVFVFAFLYFRLNDPLDEQLSGIDALLLSITIQSGVGIAPIVPFSTTCKMVMILQQFLMISSYVFILYVFTL